MSTPGGGAVRYQVSHRTLYEYGRQVVHAHQLLHLTPRPLAHQICLSHRLAIDPQPATRRDALDAFGNTVTRLELDRPHQRLEVEATMEVEVVPRASPDGARSLAWESVRNELRYGAHPLGAEALEVLPFFTESAHVRIKSALAAYAADCFTPGRPVLVAAEQLMRKIHREFTYAPGETSIATPLMQVHEQRRGVCQDYAHFMISCLRSVGLAARYVSGYLRTGSAEEESAGEDSSEGEDDDLVGADASHAWVAVHAPPFGWVDLDPTNGILVGRDHVSLAWGRDFADVSPLRGVILGGGKHELTVAVAVRPMK